MSGAFDCADLETIKKKILELQLDADVEYLALVFVNESAKMEINGHSFWTARRVAQGSVLGPLFWVLFTDSLAIKLHNVMRIKHLRPYPVLLYADDVAILLDLQDSKETDLVEKALNDWAIDTRMTWSASKSYLIIGGANQSNTTMIKLHGKAVSLAENIKYLG